MRGWAYATQTLVRASLVAFVVVLLMGLTSALYGLPWVRGVLEPMGIDLRAPRALHTLFAAAALAQGGLAAMTHWLGRGAPMRPEERWMVGGALLCFVLVGGAALISLPLGHFSGREYLGFHPALAPPLLLGWGLLGAVFFRRAARGLLGQPVYVLMWALGFVFFAVTFIEQYAWVVPEVFADPVVDRRLQWKATGTLVGAVNLFVYACALYLGEQLSGDRDLARSTPAFALFGLGLLNSFTNFAHHTYHLPQSHLVKGIAFVVSMTEVVVLLSVLRTIVDAAPPTGAPSGLLRSSRWWTAAIVASAVLMSIPPLNAVIHGTWLVAGHAMGAMIGIDTLVILAFVAWLLDEPNELLHRRRLLDLALLLFVGWLHLAGIADGWARLKADPVAISSFAYRPEWLRVTLYPGIGLSGALLAGALTWVLARWLPGAFSGRLSPFARDPGIAQTKQLGPP